MKQFALDAVKFIGCYWYWPFSATLVCVLIWSAAILFNDYNKAENYHNKTAKTGEQLRKSIKLRLLPHYKIEAERSMRKERVAEQNMKSQWYAAKWAWFTTASALIGIFLLVLILLETAKTHRHAMAAAKAAKQQAEISEDVYRKLERPYVSEMPGKLLIGHIEKFADGPSVELHIANFGRTPAILKQISAHLVVSVGPPGDQVIKHQSHFADKGPFVLVKDGPTRTIGVSFIDDTFTNQDRDDVFVNLKKQIWLAGEIFYQDMQGQVYDLPFEWEFEAESRQFIRRSKPANQSRDHPKMKYQMPHSYPRDDRVPKFEE